MNKLHGAYVSFVVELLSKSLFSEITRKTWDYFQFYNKNPEFLTEHRTRYRELIL